MLILLKPGSGALVDRCVVDVWDLKALCELIVHMGTRTAHIIQWAYRLAV